MNNREDVIRQLEWLVFNFPWQDKPESDADRMCNAIHKYVQDAIDLLKKSFTPDEAYFAVIEHGRHDRRFRLGDPIKYSFPEVIDILRIEVMCKAGDM